MVPFKLVSSSWLVSLCVSVCVCTNVADTIPDGAAASRLQPQVDAAAIVDVAGRDFPLPN